MGPKAGTSKEDTSKAGTSEASEDEPAPPKQMERLNIYPGGDKPQKILDTLDANRTTGDFCDVQLKLSPSLTVYAHKAILAACSPYFEGMFTSTFMEATSDVVDMSSSTDNPEVLENVINSFYGHQFEITEENAGEVLNLATMLLIDDLRATCARMMRASVGVRNAAEMLQLAFNFQIEDLKELVTPIIKARFHDYIMFQEDLVEMGNECFKYILEKVYTGFIARRAEYIRLVLNWFSRAEGDERAEIAMLGLTEHMSFRVTKYLYKEIEKDVQEVVESLEEANSDVSEDVRLKFIHILKKLKPSGYAKEETYESDIEIKPGPERFRSIKKLEYGPRTCEKGYTKEEEELWRQHRSEMENLAKLEAEWEERMKKRPNKRRELVDLNYEEPEEDKTLRHELFNAGRVHEKVTGLHKTRKLRVKTSQELEYESRLLDIVVVLAPSMEYLESSGKPNEDGLVYDIMDICAYVPRKRAWYKLGSLSASGFREKPNRGPPLSSGSSRRRPGAGPPDMDMEDMEEMMHEFGPDVPEMMMMMEDMPGPYRRRFMDQMSRRRMPPRMMHRMMEEEGFIDHPMMMMMMMGDMPRHGFMGGNRAQKGRSSVKSLLEGSWKMAYMKQKLYFYHKGINDTVWCYDLVSQMWRETTFSTKTKDRERHFMEMDEGLELITFGEVLYAVVTLAWIDTSNDFWSRRYRSECNTTTIKTKFKILQMKDGGKWEEVYETSANETFIDKNQFEKFDETEAKKDPYSQDNIQPLQPDVLKTVLFMEDEMKLDIFLLQRSIYNDKTIFRPAYISIVFLDLQEDDRMIDIPHHHNFIRQWTPLLFDDLVALLNDNLKIDSALDLAKPGDLFRCYEYLGGNAETSSEFLDAETLYPKCPTLMTSNGRYLWILQGRERNISEMTEVTSKFNQSRYNREVCTTLSVPPPFSTFSLAAPGVMDRNVVRMLNPPTKYIHM